MLYFTISNFSTNQSFRKRIRHSLTLTIFTPKWMMYLLKKDETVVRDFARFGLNVVGIQDQDDDMANAKAGIEALQHLVK